MKLYWKNVNIRTFLARRLRNIESFNKVFPLGAGGDARYNYIVWMTHLNRLNTNGFTGVPKTVAELGPGDSIGVGLAALLSGAESYVGLDVHNYYDVQKNLQYFDDILDLFERKAAIGGGIKFPHKILTEEVLKKSLNPARIEKIRKELSNISPDNKMIKYVAPWSDPKFIQANSVDFILSQCVLEHVGKLEECYLSMFDWLNIDGYMSHLIDFQCHSFAKEWNNHWFWSEEKWQFVKGGDKYDFTAFNRIPASKHVELTKSSGFNNLKLEPLKRESNLEHNQLSSNFSWLTEEDITTSGLILFAQK